LGFLPSFTYTEDCFTFETGSLLVIYSDGITEAMDANEQEFGEDRLMQIIRKTYDRHPSEIVDAILNEVRTHARQVPQMDDQTLVVIKRSVE
jgi:sigma-B regulation protein RsbU (phosphoserine phosphatase)